MTIYTITLTNKKTGRDISRDYDLDKKNFDEFPENISDMKSTLDDSQEKF